MSKLFKNIFTAGLVLPLSVALLGLPAPALAASLEVEFQNQPLFSQTNLVPGGSVDKWIKVTNNSGTGQNVAIEAINVSDPHGLGAVLDFSIKQGVDTLFIGSLADFFAAGETFLSVLGNGNTAQYDLSVSLPHGTGNSFQGKTLSFDILIGFQGSVGVSSGGGGTILPPGLTISEESVFVIDITETSATVIWSTNYASTSQVIYGLQSANPTLDLGAPRYGYPLAFPEPEDMNKVFSHSVTLTGLISGEAYVFRVVSHASPAALSRQYNFQTLSPGEEGVGGGPDNDEIGQGFAGFVGTPAFLGLFDDDPDALEEQEELDGDENDGGVLGDVDVVAGDTDGGLTLWWLLPLVLLIFLFLLYRRRKGQNESQS